MHGDRLIVDRSGYCMRLDHETCGSGRLEVMFLATTYVCDCDCHYVARIQQQDHMLASMSTRTSLVVN